MKKFLKVFIVVLLVLGVIGGTAYFFFANLEEVNHRTPSIVAMLKSEDKATFNSKIQSVNSIVNSDSLDNRISLILETNTKLDEIVYLLSTYFVDSNTEVENEKLAKNYKNLNEESSLLTKMMDEYLIKKNSSYFNRHVGANDLYVQACSYLVSYAEFANTLNIVVSSKSLQEFKFNMFDLYTNVVASTFIRTNVEMNSSSLFIVSDFSNISTINAIVKIRDNNLVKIKNENKDNEEVSIVNSSNVSLFNNYYAKCNKKSFAKNLGTNLNSATNVAGSSNESCAAYYLKGIYEI